jgi:lipoate-protein ligase A
MTTTRWRLINSGFMTGSENMALDEALLESVVNGASDPILRFYRWAPATVTLGYAQPLAKAVNLSACQQLGIDVVRRCTGGRAVLHADDVTYSVIAPERDGPFPGDILGSYRMIAEALRDALCKLGLTAVLTPRRERNIKEETTHPSACFVAPSSYELVYDGCKMTGSAQKRNGTAFLQHGSIPVNLDPVLLSRALNPDDCDHQQAAAQFSRKIGWLNRWLEQPTTIDAVESTLIAAFNSCFGFELNEDSLTDVEHQRMRQLSSTRYAKILDYEH